MVNYVAINCSTEYELESQNLKSSFESVFRYTKLVNVHVIFNFKSPIDTIGFYKYVIFIDVPYAQGNYFRSIRNKVYLNSIAIAVREYEDNDVIDVDNSSIYTSKGSWSYIESISSVKKNICRFVRDNFQEVKHFDVCVFHVLSSANCNKKGLNGNLIYNRPLPLYDVISAATEEVVSNDGKKSNCLVFKNNSLSSKWSDFIPSFIDVCDAYTKQGILTIKKINAISEEHSNQKIERACEVAGNKLCIVTGKAGTGKSLVLMKVMYRKVKKDEEKRNHRCRFLTYNNMLVMDIKQTIKNMGAFTACNASITTLHKYFQDIYLSSPVRILHMDQSKVNKIFAKCHLRVSNMVLLMQYYHDTINAEPIEAPKILSYFCKNTKRIKPEDYKECELFCNYLYNNSRYVDFSLLELQAKIYEKEKRELFELNYSKNEFLNGYNKILEDLYFMFHNKQEFIDKYGMKVTYSESELRNTEEFRIRYEALYDRFMKEAKERFSEENDLMNEEMVSSFIEEESKILEELSEETKRQSEAAVANFEDQVQKIMRKVNWSDLILVDEAQDCNPFEKALLLEMHGSDNVVIATGGKDQLIRTSLETNWTALFGKQLDSETIRLDYVHRQKANIVTFINEYAKVFNFDTHLTASESTKNQGKVIVDARVNLPKRTLPSDIIDQLYISGKDYGCSDYENMMFLFPGGDYLQYSQSDNPNYEVSIDKNDTVSFRSVNSERSLAVKLPDYLTALDATINKKGELLNAIGAHKVRCLLYESCRGLEAWNVMCIDLDTFFEDRYACQEAERYASEYAGLFVEENILETYKERYAALWVFMAITRAMDTLYIRLSSPHSAFSQKIIQLAQSTSGIELLQGNYDNSVESNNRNNQ